MLAVYLAGGMPGYVWHRHDVPMTTDTSSRKQIEQSIAHIKCGICLHTTAGAATPECIFLPKPISAAQAYFSSQLFSLYYSPVQLPAGRGPPLSA